MTAQPVPIYLSFTLVQERIWFNEYREYVKVKRDLKETPMGFPNWFAKTRKRKLVPLMGHRQRADGESALAVKCHDPVDAVEFKLKWFD